MKVINLLNRRKKMKQKVSQDEKKTVFERGKAPDEDLSTMSPLEGDDEVKLASAETISESVKLILKREKMKEQD